MHATFDATQIVATLRGAIESFDYIDAAPNLVPHERPYHVPMRAPIAVAGWADAPMRDGEPPAVLVVVDDYHVTVADSGLARTALAREKGTHEFIGFRAAVDTTLLPPGHHVVRVVALGDDARWGEVAAAAFEVFDDARPQLPWRERPLRLTVDVAGDLRTREAGPVTQGCPALIAGWAYDRERRCAPAGVVAIAGDGTAISAPCTVPRPDVVAAYGIADARVGYEIIVPTGLLPRGEHAFRVAAYDGDGRCVSPAERARIVIAGPERMFPGTARLHDRAIRFAGALTVLAEDEPETIVLGRAGRAPVTVARRTACVLDGWALDDDGAGAEDVYLEVAPRGLDEPIPPHRHAATAGFAVDEGDEPHGLVAAPAPNAWFRCRFGTAELRPGTWDLTLAVVQPGRRDVSRMPIGTLLVEKPTAPRR